jgi:hypothetical protein
MKTSSLKDLISKISRANIRDAIRVHFSDSEIKEFRVRLLDIIGSEQQMLVAA